MLGSFIAHTLNGLYWGSILFLITAGLSIVLGILGVLNLAHGELYALGAYLGITVFGLLMGLVVIPETIAQYILFGGIILLGILIAAAILIPLASIIEVVLFRPIYDRAEEYQLLLTFGLLLILHDGIKLFWGEGSVSSSAPYSGLNRIPTTELVGFSYPSYNIFVIISGFILFVSLLWFFDNTKQGLIIRALAIDREMATAIGIDTKKMFTVVFAFGAFLAGMGGAMAAPPITANLGMGIEPLILAFVIIVIGGVGSIKGTYIAAIMVGLLSRWATWLYPPVELVIPFLLMLIVLLIKPQGLFSSWGELS
ncbi:branched-chain amino acid ABC transporter permease [Natronorarus salvus]|uniref:branched-chain amino acid ABC transporter permease n=1 Tax=Natronorarus salvus TaxID=3117733 RepID=UPI002F268EC1